MIKRHLTLLLTLLLIFQHCTVAVPIAATKLDKSPDYAEIYNVKKLYKESYIKITKTNDEIVYGEVMEWRLLPSPENMPLDKIIEPGYEHFFPAKNDTLLLNTRFSTYSGLYDRFDFDNILLIDESGAEHTIEFKRIQTATRNGEPFNIGKMGQIVKSHQPYELKIKSENKTLLVNSNNIIKLEKLRFKPWVPMGVLVGLSIDFSIFMIWLLSNVGIASG